jgi:hypothetical protein
MSQKILILCASLLSVVLALPQGPDSQSCIPGPDYPCTTEQLSTLYEPSTAVLPTDYYAPTPIASGEVVSASSEYLPEETPLYEPYPCMNYTVTVTEYGTYIPITIGSSSQEYSTTTESGITTDYATTTTEALPATEVPAVLPPALHL